MYYGRIWSRCTQGRSSSRSKQSWYFFYSATLVRSQHLQGRSGARRSLSTPKHVITKCYQYGSSVPSHCATSIVALRWAAWTHLGLRTRAAGVRRARDFGRPTESLTIQLCSHFNPLPIGKLVQSLNLSGLVLGSSIHYLLCSVSHFNPLPIGFGKLVQSHPYEYTYANLTPMSPPKD
jgi:hypothetical protein